MNARRSLRWIAVIAWAAMLPACTNNPYPDADDALKVRYLTLPGPPKTLDPAVTYSALEHKITSNVYETLLEYHYLKRPYELMPGLAADVPSPHPLPGGGVSYSFRLRPGMRYQSDPCFALGGEGRDTREILAADVAFEITRIADPVLASPVVTTFSKVEGFAAFAERLAARRESDPDFATLRPDEQYAAVGGIEGLRVHGPHALEVVLTEPFPQILYWFAMPFTAPVPWEAVAWYDGSDGRATFREHPISTGPFQISHYDKRSRIVLDRNPNWYGALHPEWRAPGTVYPEEGAPGDVEAGHLDERYRGRPLPMIDRIEFRLEKESIPVFNKFLQGYYDATGVIRESFDEVVHEGALSEDMVARGIRLVKSVEMDVRYIAFNMSDPLVGSRAGARGRKLRQAMSLAIDVDEYKRVFNNGRGIPAQSPIPPGLFGYEPDYRNPYRTLDLERAKALLAEAGYEDGIDPETGAPLRLQFDLGSTDTRTRVAMQFYLDAWRQLGLDVRLAATNYNEFRDKVRRGAYQIFSWGWIGDYPDPENFLFLLWGEMAQDRNPGAVNSANFVNERYDALFMRMQHLPNGPERLAIIREMRAILEEERPWIELLHSEGYALYHGWIHNVKPSGIEFPNAKYVDIEPAKRAALRDDWNRPVLWPAWALGALATAVVLPGIVTFFRERQ
jgi:ABC-type transport system substrate-binding protein